MPQNTKDMIVITNAGLNETREISRADWDRAEKRLREKGWERPEDEAGAQKDS